MNLLVDESVDAEIVQRLRAEGHSTVYVAELAPGISDEDLLRDAHASRSLLVTCDKDFGELVYRRGQAHHGVLLLRLAGLPAASKAAAVAIALQHSEELVGAFSVVSPGAVRIRRAGTPEP